MANEKIRTKQDAIDFVNEQYKNHCEKWLTMEVAKEYQAKAESIKCQSNEISGQLYELARELVREYGVTQLEAVNILNGFYLEDYVNKYWRIKNRLPLDIKEKKKEDKTKELYAKGGVMLKEESLTSVSELIDEITKTNRFVPVSDPNSTGLPPELSDDDIREVIERLGTYEKEKRHSTIVNLYK